jgi:hypothetical protein
LWLFFLFAAFWLLQFFVFELAFIKASIVLLPADVLPVLGEDLQSELVEGLLEV